MAGMAHVDVMAWLLDSDPSLQFQVQRDLLDAPVSVWQRTKARTATEGYGAMLLAKQDPDGQWAGGAYFPRANDWQGEPGQPWTATTWSLNMLRMWGVDAEALGDTAEKLAANSRWEYDDLPYWGGEVDVCINAFTLENGLWLGVDMAPLAGWFFEHSLPDGGFNCEWENGSVRSSFHSTINALFALLAFERAGFATSDLTAVRKRAEEYLLERRLLYSLRTGERVGVWAESFLAIPRHAYSALRALDYFRLAALHDGTSPDARLAGAVELVREKQQPDGRWLNDHHLPGRVWFTIDEPVGEPSRNVTLQALRVLRWIDDDAVDHP